MTRYTLPISPSYVAHWGLWQAVREILQNAYDQQSLDPECLVIVNYDPTDGSLSIETSKGSLSKSSLVLGNTTKSNEPSLRGKFGEGYKLALLVLCRLGIKVHIYTENEIWMPSIEHSDLYDSDVLFINVAETEKSEGVDFQIKGITEEQWTDIKKNIGPKAERILHETSEVGRIYVGGLYVNTLKDYKKGYAFSCQDIQLDRDRQMVSDFDLARLTSKLWSRHDKDDEAVQLLESEASDVKYVEYIDLPKEAPIVRRTYFSWNPDVVPVTTQEEIETVANAGLKWKLVPAGLKYILNKIKTWFIPSTKSPLERLKTLRNRLNYSLCGDDLLELDNIIQTMESLP